MQGEGADQGGSSLVLDHVKRNQMLMSKYRQVNGIKSQINQDVMYTRLFNSQQKAQMLDN